jgi:hypothetical protein
MHNWFCQEQRGIVTYKTWIWTGTWIYSLRLQATTNYNPWNSCFDSTGSSLGSASSIGSALVGPWIPHSSFWSNQTARLARLLDSNSTCLWTGLWLLSCFSLFCWTPCYYSLVILISPLNSSGVRPKMSLRGPQRDYRLSPLKCDCWFTAETRIRNKSCIVGGGELPWIPACVWLLWNRSHLYTLHHNPLIQLWEVYIILNSPSLKVITAIYAENLE